MNFRAHVQNCVVCSEFTQPFIFNMLYHSTFLRIIRLLFLSNRIFQNINSLLMSHLIRFVFVMSCIVIRPGLCIYSVGSGHPFYTSFFLNLLMKNSWLENIIRLQNKVVSYCSLFHFSMVT